MRRNFATGVSAGAGLVLAGLLIGAQAAQPSVVGVGVDQGYLYRVLDNGNVEFIPLKSEVTAAGVADWTELAVDKGRKARKLPR